MSDPTRRLLVGATAAPMFRDPDPASEQVSQALLGDPVEALETARDWARIRTWDNYSGWVRVLALESALEAWQAPFREVDDLWANLRVAPDSKLASVIPAPIGARLPQCGEDERWVQLLVPDGRRLWTEAHRTRPVTEKPLRPARPAALVRTARRFLGLPYLWGGCSPWGLDCSGFVQLVYRLHGVPLRRDAHLQFDDGAPTDEPAAGDLVFFGPEDRPERITHVGMMLDGRRYIHAKGSACVRIDVLDRGALTFREARRFL